MLKFQIISSIAAMAVMINFLVKLKFDTPEDEAPSENITKELASNPKKKINSQSIRAPASVKQKKEAPFIPEVKRSELDHSNFASTPVPKASRSAPVIPGGYIGGNYPSLPQAQTPASIPLPLVRENAQVATFESPTHRGPPTKPSDPTKPVIIEPPLKPTDPTTFKPFVTCTSNITGGSFSNPIGINLSCSSISTIKYCIALDTGSGCCDPEASAITYSSQIVIGPKNGTYCLSYYGESASAGTSVIYQQSYTINSTLPNLLVAHPQVYYQTTQLAGKSIINSTNFGDTGFNIGQINLKTHDPGPAAENLDCDQIIANYVSLPAPNPLAVLSLLDVSLDNPAVQIEIPLRLDQLDYGDNFITSYIANNNFVAPVYACSTTKVVLNDFEFFQEELAFGDIGDNSVREFTGGFSSYGFFEQDEANISRGPAGENTEEKTGQKLEYGMFGIFY